MNNNSQTVQDILNEIGKIGDIGILSICEYNVEHAYIGEDDITSIDVDILNKKVVSSLVVKRFDAYEVYLDI